MAIKLLEGRRKEISRKQTDPSQSGTKSGWLEPLHNLAQEGSGTYQE